MGLVSEKSLLSASFLHESVVFSLESTVCGSSAKVSFFVVLVVYTMDKILYHVEADVFVGEHFFYSC